MHLAVIFENIGGYHAARLRAAQTECEKEGWRLTAIQITCAQGEHPWGGIDAQPFQIVSLDDPARSNGQQTGAAMTCALDELRPDAVAIPGWGFDYSRAALRWSRRRHVAAILMSESKEDDEPRARWKEFLKSLLYVKNFQAALVGAEAHREYLVKLGLPREKIFQGYDVVDNDYFAEKADAARAHPHLARDRHTAIPDSPYFLAVTRFILRKNLRCLIAAYAKYRERSGATPWALVLCGSGSEEESLRNLIRESSLENCVHLPGFVSYREIGDWYGLAGALIHPALQEQWGLVVNEAMAAGLPVLVSARCGCFPELVRPVGFGFDPCNESELTDLMLKISHPLADRASLGAAAKRQVEKFAPREFGAGLMQATRSALTFV
ncbi:MAG: hypothetical protein QOD99_2436 [Chthoniobacter sp.]|jgi:glycosyltransferase involved in cell wall biosynthesis|nr:hypothetical protein [Chthoniobacter sp.]